MLAMHPLHPSDAWMQRMQVLCKAKKAKDAKHVILQIFDLYKNLINY